VTYVGTVLADVVYFPAKVVFAGAGALTGAWPMCSHSVIPAYQTACGTRRSMAPTS